MLFRQASRIIASLVVLLLAQRLAEASTVFKANNSIALIQTNSWQAGGPPGVTDLAAWDGAVVNVNGTVSLSGALAWEGIVIGLPTQPGGHIILNPPGSLNLGQSGINVAGATRNLTINTALNLASTQVWDVVTAARILLVAGEIGGAGPLTKSGAGTLTLSAANSFTGGTEINAGTVSIGANAALGDAANAVTFRGNGTLSMTTAGTYGSGRMLYLETSGTTGTLSSAVNVLWAGQIDGAGDLAKAGTGLLTLSGDNSHTGATVIAGGVLQAAFDTGWSPHSNLRLAGGVLEGTSGGSFTYELGSAAGQIQWLGSGGFSATNGDLTVDLGGAGNTLAWNSTTGFVASGGVLIFSSGFADSTVNFANPVDLNGAVRTIQVENGSAVVDAELTEPLSGVGGGLTKTGTGTLRLSNGNTFDAGLWVQGGAVTANEWSDTTPGAGPIQLGTTTSSGQIEYTGDADAVLATRGIELLGTTGDGIVAVNGAGTLSVASFVASTSANTQGRDLILTGANTGTNTIAGPITQLNPSTAMGVIKNGDGLWQLAGTNAYEGLTTVNAGVLRLINPEILHDNGTVRVAGGTLDLGGHTESVANLNLASGVITNGTLAVLVNMTSDSGTASAEIQGLFTPLTKLTTGTTTLTAANPFGGQVSINNGRLVLMHLGDTINGAGAIRLGTGTTTGELDYQGDAAVALTRTLDLTGTTGGGTLSVNGAGTVSVATFINSAPSGTGKAFTLSGANTGSNRVDGPITNGGANITRLVKTGIGRWILNGANLYSGVTTVSDGTLQIGVGGLTGVLPTNAVITAPGVLAFNRSDTVMYSGFLSGTGTLRQEGGGNLVLANANAYSGGTFINAGVLTLGHATALGPIASARATFGPASSGTLRLNGFSPTLVGLSGDATATVENGSGAAASVLSLATAAGTHEFSGVLQNGGAQALTLIKSGVGTLDLGGSNTYSGTTTINAGILQIREETQLGSDPAIFAAGHLTLAGATAQLRTTETFAIDAANRGVTLGAGGGSVGVAAGTTLTLATPITGAGALTKLENGVLVLAADNTYAATTISGGELQVGNGGATGSLGVGATVNNGVLTLNRGTDATYGAAISGTGTVNKVGAGAFALTGASTRTGITQILAGVLRINAETGLGGNPAVAAPDNLLLNGGTLIAGATFLIDDANRGITVGPNGGGLGADPTFSLTETRPIAGPGTLTKRGGGTTILTGDNTYGGSTIIAEGVLQIGSGAALGSLTGNVTNHGSLVFNRSDPYVFPGLIDGTGGVIKAGASTLLFEGLNTFSGPLWVQNGMLTLVCLGDAFNGGGDIRLGSAALTGELEYTAAATVITARGIDLAGTTGGGRLTVNGAGPVRIGGNVTASTAGIKVLTLQGANTGANMIAGSIADSAAGATSLIKAGDGRWVLASGSTYSGTTAINTGVLNIRDAAALGAAGGATTVAGGATLELQNGIAVGAEPLTLGGTGVEAMGALRSLNGDNSWGGTITLSAGGARVQADADSLTLGTFAGNTQPLTLGGAGTIMLNGAVNTTSGSVTVDGPGTVMLGLADRLSNASPLVVNAGAFDLNSLAETVAGITLFDGEIRSTGNGGMLTGTVVNAHKGTISAPLGDVTSTPVTPFNKLSGGTVSLTRTDNQFAGMTSIQEGVLEIRNVAALGLASSLGQPVTALNGTIDLGADTNSATLRLTGAGGDSFSDRVLNLAGTTGPVSLDASGNGLLYLSSALTVTGIGAKTLTLTGSHTGTNTLAGAIPNSGGGSTAIFKSGTGQWVLQGNNTYSGGTVVNNGTLMVNNSAGSGTGSGPVQVNTGAQLGGRGTIAGSVTVASGASLSPGASVGTQTVGSLSLAAGSEVTIEFNGTPAHDQVVVTTPGGLTLNGGGFYLYAEGTTTPWTTPGVYRLFQYGGAISGTGVSALSVLNPQPGHTYDFRTNAGWVELRLTAGIPLVSIGDAVILEGNAGTTPLNFPVTVDPTGSVAVTVNYITIDSTAKAANGDYTHTVGMLTIPAGTATVQLPVQIAGELKFELDETFTVQLSSPTNATLARDTATGTILNNDAADGRIYVKANATGNNNGLNWDDGFNDLQDAMRIATAGQQIWVAKGTYYPTNAAGSTAAVFSLRPNVSLYGGFVGTEAMLSQRVGTNNPSVLSGDIGTLGVTFDNCSRIVLASSATGAIIDGFFIRDAYGAAQGAGMHISGAPITVRNCIFEYNHGDEAGGLHTSQSALIERTIFRFNTCASRGGAVQSYSASPTFKNCLFQQNSSGSNGGAMSLYHQPMTLINCTFSGNNCSDNGNSLYVSNYGTPTLINCIMWDTGEGGGGIHAKPWNGSNESGDISLIHCNVRGGVSIDPTYLGTTMNNIDADPLFVSEVSQNFRLQTASPCKDAATSVNAPADDLDGGTRPVGDGFDMGAYEFGSVGPGNPDTGLMITIW